MNLNKAMIIGNLTRDPEVKTTPGGQTVATFSVATNFVWKDQTGEKKKKTEYHNVVAWRRLGEICGQYLKKGNKVYVEGRIQTREWQSQDGSKRHKTEIIAENMIMLDTRGGGDGGFSPQAPQAPKQQIENTMEPAATPADDEIRIEDIPF